MIIQLDLSRHCIETASRLGREALVRACLKGPAPGDEARLHLLTHFLEQADFPALRTQMDTVATGAQTAALDFPDPPSPRRLRIHVGNQVIPPMWKA